MKQKLNSSTKVDVTTSAQIMPNPMLAAGLTCPMRITQTWRTTSFNSVTRKWTQIPIVKSQETYWDKLKSVKREVWFEYIKKGWLHVTINLREWLDNNGYSEIKRLP